MNNPSVNPTKSIDFKSVFLESATPCLILEPNSPDFTIAEVNETYLRVTGTDRGDLIGKNVFDVFPVNPDSAEIKNVDKAITIFDKVLQSNKEQIQSLYRYDIPDPNNPGLFQEKYWYTMNTPLRDVKGNVTHILHSPIDMTEMHKLQQKEKQLTITQEIQRKKLFSVFMQAPVGIGIFRGDDYIVDLVNLELCKLYGKSQEELIGKPIFAVLKDAAGLGFEELLDNVRNTGEAYIGLEVAVPLEKNNEDVIVYVNVVFEPLREIDESISSVIAVAIDVTEQVKNKHKLQSSESELRFMANSIPVQVWTAQPNGELDYVNDQTSIYFGKNIDQIIGNNWKYGVHPDDLNTSAEAWIRSLETGEPYQAEFRLKNKEGVFRWHIARALPLISDGIVIKWFGTNTDIEDQKRIEQKKDEFISIASHELKTPLTTLKASLQLLNRMIKSSPIDNSISSLVDKSTSSFTKLNNLIEDLLNVTKLKEGQLVLNKSTFKISDIINDCCEHVRNEGKHEILLEGDIDIEMYADPHRIDQVIVNFVNNAIKYAPESNKIHIFIEEELNDIKVSVKDEGKGIPSDKTEHLFKRYYQVDDKGTQLSGLGLGLYICSEIIKRHGGKIGVESELGQGSTFWFTIPKP